jgi:predicted transcriptional regulator
MSPDSGSAVPLMNRIVTNRGRVGGIRRIYPKNVLDHPDRAVVYNAIVARHGIDTAVIADETGINRETLRYHLHKPEAATRVVVMRDRGIVRYFENPCRYTLLERSVLQHLLNSTGRSSH